MRRIVLMLLSSFLVYAALAQDSEPKTISLTDAERALVEQNSDFAFNLFRKTRDTENHVISMRDDFRTIYGTGVEKVNFTFPAAQQ